MTIDELRKRRYSLFGRPRIIVTLEITLDTQTFTKTDFDVLFQGGTLLTVTGVVNRRWDEFSAVEAAQGFGLQSVHWEQTWDDSPGSLTLLVNYVCAKGEILARLRRVDGVDDYRLYTLFWPF